MNKRILFFANQKDGCYWYRTYLPYKFLRNHSMYLSLDFNPIVDFKVEYMNYDIFIFQRPHQAYLYKEFFKWLRQNKKKIIIDMDDNLFQIPDYNSSKDYWTPSVLEDLKANLEFADMITCSTVPLADYLSNLVSNPSKIFIIPNMLEDVYPFRKVENQKVKVGWTGSTSHDGDFTESLIKELCRLVKNGSIELEIFGHIPHFFEGVAKEIPWCPVDNYLQTLYSLNWDIGLIVCKNNPLGESKSNLKFLEYSSVSTTTIADCVYPYATTINSNTGLIVRQPSDWKTHLKTLLTNKEERLRLSYNAHSFVKNNFTYNINQENYINMWYNLLW